MSEKYMKGPDRRASILSAAVEAAKVHGFNNFRLVHVAERANCSTGLVMLHYKTMDQIRRDVMRAAIREKLLPIIAVGIVLKHPQCRRITEELRDEALAAV